MSRNLHPGLNLGAAHGVAHTRSENLVFGFWVFLMSDLITFSILFATYSASTGARAMAGGPSPAELFNLTSVAAQTGLLLASSLTCGLASLALKYNEGARRIIQWLALTALLGAGFLAFELTDFAGMIAKGGAPTRSSWLSALYTLVGLHGLHITAGLVWISVVMTLIATRGLSDRVKSHVLIFALYWHFLDLVWIGIFSVVFLQGLA